MTAAPDLDNPVVFAAGTEYSVAIARMLFMALPGVDYGIDLPDTGRTIPELHYREDADWLMAAHDLAMAIGKRLMRVPSSIYSDGLYRLVTDDPEERKLAMELAFRTGHVDVDAMLASMTSVQWDEWKYWLRWLHRRDHPVSRSSRERD